MNQQIKQRWIEALRSGKYLQDRGLLRSVQTDGFCCLGVLCDLYIQDHPEVQWEQDLQGEQYAIYGETGVLPSIVMTWANLSEANPEIKVPENDYTGFCLSSLAGINDLGGTFKQIAKVIEEQL